MDFTALHITGGWIALGVLILYFPAALVVHIHNLLFVTPLKHTADAAGEYTTQGVHSTTLFKATGLLAILSAFLFNTWFFFGGGHDLVMNFIATITSLPALQGVLLVVLLTFTAFLPWLLMRIIKPESARGMRTGGSTFWQTEKLKMIVIVFIIMLGLLLLICWLLWRFKFVTTAFIALIIFYLFIRKTHWFSERRLSANKKKQPVSSDDSRYTLLSAWLSRVGSGVTAIFYEQGRKGAFIRDNKGEKVLVIHFFESDPLSSEELIFYSARALMRNRSAARQQRSRALLFAGIAGACIYFWAGATSAMPAVLGLQMPYYFTGQLLAAGAAFIICIHLAQWLANAPAQQMDDETDTFLFAYADQAVLQVLKRKLEEVLKDAGDVHLSENSWLLTPKQGIFLKKRLNRVKDQLDKYH